MSLAKRLQWIENCQPRRATGFGRGRWQRTATGQERTLLERENNEIGLMNTIAVNSVGAADLAEIEEFYNKTVGYGGGVSQSDFTLAARLDGSLVGAVRLCVENGIIVLRGMQVASAFQRQGIGRALLDHCVPFLNRGPAYCVPYEHLTDFYGQVGFIVTPPELLPAFLAERLAEYVATSRRTLAMKRMPA